MFPYFRARTLSSTLSLAICEYTYAIGTRADRVHEIPSTLKSDLHPIFLIHQSWLSNYYYALINQYEYGKTIEKFLSYISSNPRKMAKSIFHFSPPYLMKLDRNREYVIRRSPINPSRLLNLRKNNWANIISLKEKKKKRIGRRKLIEISIS